MVRQSFVNGAAVSPELAALLRAESTLSEGPKPAQRRPARYVGYATDDEAWEAIYAKFGRDSYTTWELVRVVQFKSDGRWGVELYSEPEDGEFDFERFV